jgi:hypothetical protein
MTATAATARLLSLLAIQLVCYLGTAFVAPLPRNHAASCVGVRVRMASPLDGRSDDNSFPPPPQGSRLSGNQRPPTPQEIDAMDQMIDKLAEAKPYELPTAVQRAFRVISSPQFFLRIAARQDQASSQLQREKLQALASNLVSTLEAVVSTTEDRLDERAQQIRTVVATAAEPDSGEFFVPLAPERIAAMRTAMNKIDPADFDEGFVSTLEAWMSKSHADGLEGMVTILQKVLQIYAGVAIRQARKEQRTTAVSNSQVPQLVDQMLVTDAEEWDSLLLQHQDKLGQIVSEIQAAMESIVLGLNAGSTAQQVQAEYLQEMAKRAESLHRKKS